ncbi:MAG: hypothetical protein ISR95_06350 [Candidatus Marinimicrobia bacterium]|nr:hypothetical protein [Candidatus Neomarinimicrobiota bacterium]
MSIRKITEWEIRYIDEKMGRSPTSLELSLLSHLWSGQISHKNVISIMDSVTQFGENIITDFPFQSIGFIDTVADTSLIVGMITLPPLTGIRKSRQKINELLLEIATLGAIPLEVIKKKNTILVLGTLEKKLVKKPTTFSEGNLLYLLRSPASKHLQKCVLELHHHSYVRSLKIIDEGGLIVACTNLAREGKCGIDCYVQSFPEGKKNSHKKILIRKYFGSVLAVVIRGFEKEIHKISQKNNVECIQVGKVTGEDVLRFQLTGQEVAEIPNSLMFPSSDTLSVSNQELGKPKYLEKVNSLDLSEVRQPADFNQTLVKLVSSPDVMPDKGVLTSKKSSNAIAHIIPLEEDDRHLVVSIEGNDQFLFLDPATGGKCAMALAIRNVLCCGAIPRFVTLGVDFDDLSDPTAHYQFREALSGLGSASTVFNLPIVSTHLVTDRVSRENPNLIVGVVGDVESVDQIISQDFKDEGDFILIFGSHRGEIGGSEYLKLIHKKELGPPPSVDLLMERNLQEFIYLTKSSKMIKSAYTVSKGGLSMALVRCLLNSREGIGARIHMSSKIREDEMLFGETQGLVIVTVEEESIIEIERICMRLRLPCTAIGRVTDTGKFEFNDLISLKVEKIAEMVV